jgi:1-acyl-sn-glycerol-3-phosphate acyltransferase
MEIHAAMPQRANAPPRPRPRAKDNAPEDGESHYNPTAALFLRPLNRAAMFLLFKQEYEGLEKIPKTGAHLLCPNHQSMVDAPLMASLSNRDYRFMAAKEQFRGIQGWVMKSGGAFPVDRKNPGSKPVTYSIELLDQGKSVIMFPEGGIFRTGQVNELKSGAGRIAVSSKCESVIPVTIHYQKSEEPGLGRKAAGMAAVAGLTALTAAAACVSPTVRAITGGVTGAFAGSHFGDKPLHKALYTAGGLVVGAVTGALSPGPAGVLTALGTGAVALKFDHYMQHRDTVRIVVGDPLKVSEYKDLYGEDADTMLTQDLSAAISGPKARMHAESPSIYPLL